MTKAQVREDLLARRRAMTPVERADAAEAIALHVLAVPAIVRARRVACYVSMRSEPGTAQLNSTLQANGVEVIVPVTMADYTLDWELSGVPLGVDALSTCDAVIVPALAIDHAGHRLGRGAGYYDRALEDISAPVCALVFTHELLPEVPHEPHDVPVQMAVTPSGLFRVP